VTGRPTPDTRPCPWPTCPKRTKPRYLMCPEHWYALPEDIRAAINAAYRPGQNALTASPAYRAALRDTLEYARQHADPGPGPGILPAVGDPAGDDDVWGDDYTDDDPEAAEHDEAPEPRS
jgi:hypothetical protein